MDIAPHFSKGTWPLTIQKVAKSDTIRHFVMNRPNKDEFRGELEVPKPSNIMMAVFGARSVENDREFGEFLFACR